MGLLRTDKEVALNDLLVASRESVDHYRDAADFLEDEHVINLFRAIASQREPFIARLEEAVRALGDLPSMPDPDKETGAMLIHHAGNLLSSDYTADVLTQRIKAEQHLAELVNAARAVGLDASFGPLLDDMFTHLTQVDKQLQPLLAEKAD